MQSAAKLCSVADRALDVIDRVASFVVIAAMAVLTTVIVAQVVLRYAFNSSLDWGWEVPRLCFIVSVFLAIPLALKRGAHVGIDLLASSLPPHYRRALFRLQMLLVLGLMAIVVRYAVPLAEQTRDQLMPTLALSVSVFYFALVFGGIHSILHCLRLVLIGEAPSGGFDA